MTNWEEVAEIGYQEYLQSLATSVPGVYVKPWSRLTLPERVAWIIASKTICSAAGGVIPPPMPARRRLRAIS